MTSREKNKSGKLKIITIIIIKRNDEIDKYRLVSTFLVCGHVHNLYTTVNFFKLYSASHLRLFT